MGKTKTKGRRTPASRASVALSYEAARSKPSRRTLWSGSADGDLLPDAARLRENARAMVRDDCTTTAAAQRLCDNVVGDGIFPQFVLAPTSRNKLTPEQCDAWNAAADEFVAEWWDAADASDLGDFGDLQRVAMSDWFAHGEAFLHRVDAGKDRPVAFELIDPDRVVDPSHGGKRESAGGIKVDAFGRPVEYYVLSEHPRDNAGAKGQWLTRDTRGGIRSILHLFRRTRSGLRRGVSPVIAAFDLLEKVGGMIGSEAAAARAASRTAAVRTKRPDPGGFDPNVEVDAGGRGVDVEIQHEAQIIDLEPGETLQPFQFNRPGTTFDQFVQRVLRIACAGIGVPYEMVLMDWGQMNFSTMKGTLNEARKAFGALQKMLIAMVCKPALHAAVSAAILSGRLSPPRSGLTMQDLLRVVWQRPAFGFIDPTKEIDAAERAVRANVSSPGLEAARQGLDFDEVLVERARAAQKARAIEQQYGLPPFTLTDSAQESVARIYASGAGGGAAGKASGDTARKEGDDSEAT